MNNKHYSYRLKLEKLKQGTWVLVILAKLIAQRGDSPVGAAFKDSHRRELLGLLHGI